MDKIKVIINGKRYFLKTLLNRLSYLLEVLAKAPKSRHFKRINIKNYSVLAKQRIKLYGKGGLRDFVLETKLGSLSANYNEKKKQCDLFDFSIDNIFALLTSVCNATAVYADLDPLEALASNNSLSPAQRTFCYEYARGQVNPQAFLFESSVVYDVRIVDENGVISNQMPGENISYVDEEVKPNVPSLNTPQNKVIRRCYPDKPMLETHQEYNGKVIRRYPIDEPKKEKVEEYYGQPIRRYPL